MSGFLTAASVTNIQIDHTTRCNLLCPQCARVFQGRTNPKIPKSDLTLEDYKKILTPELMSRLESVLFCGNYGDAIASPSILETLRFLKSQGVPAITIMTNGSLRNQKWWEDLAQILNGRQDKVCFSIDGLKDTNHIYRVNSQFEVIMKNAKAFIDAGGRARWDFIVFQHNQHQVEEAMALAKEMGFYRFSLKKTTRFIKNKSFLSGEINREEKVYQPRRESLQSILPPKENRFLSQENRSFSQIFNRFGSWENYAKKTSISCRFKQSASIFIDFEARVWPCTWMASPLYSFDDSDPQHIELLKSLEPYPQHFNSLREHRLEEILGHEWFTKVLTLGWAGDSDQAPLKTCSKVCGKRFSHTSSAKGNREFFNLK